MTQRIFTRTGDAGETGLFGGQRVAKSHPRVAAYGEVDELNATLGAALVVVTEGTIRERLRSVQPDLFTIGAQLATPPRPGRKAPSIPTLASARITDLEGWIDDAESRLPELRSFIMPGGAAGGAALHVARTVCRRAERRVVDLAAAEDVADAVIVYLNRLSDLLFVWARLENQFAGETERAWMPAADGGEGPEG